MRTGAQTWSKSLIFVRFLLAACLALSAGCAEHTIVDEVWQDRDRVNVGLGKTLVLALFPDDNIGILLEDEWSQQLGNHGIGADAMNTLLPDERPPSRQRILEVVQARGLDTVLVSQLVAVKQVDRNVSAYQVVVTKVTLYDTKTEQPIWWVQADTYLVSATSDRQVNIPRKEEIREYVETMIKEMSKRGML